jgi:cobalt/nickel transport system permease protein
MGLAGRTASPVHRLDPRAKLIGLVGTTVVAVSTPFALWPVWIGCALVLAAYAAISRVTPRTVWRRARIVLPLVLFVAVFLPFTRGGETVASLGPFDITDEGLRTFGEVAAKATIGTISAVLLGATTTYPMVLRGLAAMRVPRTLTLIASFMYRYLFVIADEVRRMKAASDSRGFAPRSVLGVGAVGRIATALFLRAHARGERVYLAMLARGYSGSMPEAHSLRMRAADVVFVLAIAIALVPLRVTAGSVMA